MNMRRYIVILLSLILVGCGRGSENGKAVFNTVKNVMVQTVGDPLIIGVPVDLCAEGNCLFVLAYDQNNWLHVYDKNSGDKLGEFITPGRGPGGHEFPAGGYPGPGRLSGGDASEDGSLTARENEKIRKIPRMWAFPDLSSIRRSVCLHLRGSACIIFQN